MIRSFRSKKLRKLFEAGEVRGLPAGQISKIENRLAAISSAQRIEDINVAGYRLHHQLTGELRGFYSVWITGNWRIIFRFKDGDAYDLDYIDYH